MAAMVIKKWEIPNRRRSVVICLAPDKNPDAKDAGPMAAAAAVPTAADTASLGTRRHTHAPADADAGDEMGTAPLMRGTAGREVA